MALPGPGNPLSLSQIYGEIYGGIPFGAVSLRTLASEASFSTPDRIGEFYGYAHSYSVYVYGEYMDSVDPNTDYISGGSIQIRTYPGDSLLQSWTITPVGPTYNYFYHEFSGIPGGTTVVAKSVGVTITWNGSGVANTVTWGFGYPGTIGDTTDPITSEENVTFGYWYMYIV